MSVLIKFLISILFFVLDGGVFIL